MNRTEIRFDSGGTECAAWLYRPDGDAAQVPIVVMAHGFTGTRRDRIGPFAERFAAAGIAALAFDYRGFGDSGGEQDVVDVEAQLDDWRAAIAHARKLPGIDPERVAAWGTSLGGGHAISIAAEDGRLAAAIAQVPLVDSVRQFPRLRPETMTRMAIAAVRDRLSALSGRRPYVIPAVASAGELGFITAPGAAEGWLRVVANGEDSRWRNRAAARVVLSRPYRPLEAAHRVDCPLLVCVGDNDNVAAPPATLRVAEKASRAELRRYPIGHFDIYMGEAFERAVGDQEEFLARHLAVRD